MIVPPVIVRHGLTLGQREVLDLMLKALFRDRDRHDDDDGEDGAAERRLSSSIGRLIAAPVAADTTSPEVDARAARLEDYWRAVALATVRSNSPRK